MENEGTLEDLFVNEEKVTDELLRDLLLPYIGLNKTEDRIVPRTEFSQLAQPAKVLVYLLSRRAMVKLNVPEASFEADVRKIADHTLIPSKSCGEIVSRLKSQGLVDKNERGYFIPVHALLRIPAELGKVKGVK